MSRVYNKGFFLHVIPVCIIVPWSELLRLLEETYNNIHTYQKVIKDVHVHVRYFSRVEEFGLTYNSFINFRRGYWYNCVERHGSTTGEPFMSSYFVSKGIHVQQRRIRASINYVDPRNVALRGGSGRGGGRGQYCHRKYFVPSLIRCNFFIHGCCDGFSRKSHISQM